MKMTFKKEKCILLFVRTYVFFYYECWTYEIIYNNNKQTSMVDIIKLLWSSFWFMQEYQLDLTTNFIDQITSSQFFVKKDETKICSDWR